MADIASFKTFPLLHTDDYTTMTNPYSKYDNSSYGEFLDSAVKKLAKLAARSRKSRVCFTLALGGNQFTLRDSAHHGLGASATHAREASYSEASVFLTNQICRRNWNDVQYVDSAIGYYARSGTTWVAYDTEETIAEKVRLALRSHPNFCVMLVRVEKDDFRGICSEKHFPLAQSVKHAMRHFGNNKRFA
ncbi:hypothetical protein HPB51_013489 [Rhipicephalus microplus]|uniref:GH18 domain-containing protein n=1 Tax=Rhipicephalus microplus TaxID=6941 RepID=A0A9J6EPB5_RHIMP|nr:hypothetical protein HPB51_013489 [Rhipicephalus microplus]